MISSLEKQEKCKSHTFLSIVDANLVLFKLQK